MSDSSEDVIVIPVLINKENDFFVINCYWKKIDTDIVRKYYSSNKKFCYIECKIKIDSESFELFCIKNFFVKAIINGEDSGINSVNFLKLDQIIGKSIMQSYVDYFNNVDKDQSGSNYSKLIDSIKGKFSSDVDRFTKICYLSVSTGMRIDYLESLDSILIDKLYDISLIKENFKNIDIINAMSIMAGGKSVL